MAGQTIMGIRKVALEQEVSAARERALALEREVSTARERAVAFEQAAREATEQTTRAARESPAASKQARTALFDATDIQQRLADLGKAGSRSAKVRGSADVVMAAGAGPRWTAHQARVDRP